MSGRDVLTFAERLEVEAALDAAFEPLRELRTDLSPLRVRAAVRWGRGMTEASPEVVHAPVAVRAPAAIRWSGAIRRLSELSIAVGMSVMIFGAALGPAIPREGTRVAAPAEPTAARTNGPSIEVQREIHAMKHEWLDALRARIDDALRSVTVQDWLDPTVVRPVIRRLEAPAPRIDIVGQSAPF